MKGRQIVLGRVFGREAAALLVDGRIEDLFLDAGDAAPFAPGAILRGVVDRLVKGQGGVFLRLPGGHKAFLREKGGIREGSPVLVQVTGPAEDGKAVPVSGRLLFRGRYVIVTPSAPGVNVSRRIKRTERRDELTALAECVLADNPTGLIVRSAAEFVPDDDIAGEIARLAELATAVLADQNGGPELLVDAPGPWQAAWEEWGYPEPDDVDQGDDAFEQHDVTERIEAFLSPRIELGGGAWASIEATRALTAIDVNTGADHSMAAGLKANIALARDLARQFRLRGVGGQVVIDFAPMPKRDRGTLDQVLKTSLRQESAETTLIGWTAMGLYEISRKRDRLPLARLADQ